MGTHPRLGGASGGLGRRRLLSPAGNATQEAYTTRMYKECKAQVETQRAKLRQKDTQLRQKDTQLRQRDAELQRERSRRLTLEREVTELRARLAQR